MNTEKTFLVEILLAAALCSCSIDISQYTASPSVIPTNIPVEGSPAPILPATTPLPQQNITGSSTQIPVTWAALNLAGHLVYIAGIVKDNNLYLDIENLDLKTGEISPIFQTDSWIDAAAVSPDDTQIVIAYAPPSGGAHGSQTSLYVIPRDGTQLPTLLFTPASDQDQYDQPVWSPDGQYVYFRDVNYRASVIYSMMRVAYPGGTPEKLVDWAYWPRISGDGSHLVYVSIDPVTQVNSLYVSAADGTQIQAVSLTGAYIPKVIDVPMFSEDGKSILFSAPDPTQASMPNWIDRLMGITVANADGNIPSDWWSVPVTGGVPKRLTRVQSLALYGSFSPDKKYIASYTSDDIFVMNPDGTGVTLVVNDIGGIPGTVNWTP
jgi:Tol biopolymer transport system component